MQRECSCHGNMRPLLTRRTCLYPSQCCLFRQQLFAALEVLYHVMSSFIFCILKSTPLRSLEFDDTLFPQNIRSTYE
ncbi:uncharacterized protein K452DRAFT_128481 [Aplosporella prunicola CBS 121167]|uniref:Uncharacterized protein n=1 Tax=Aplosporella prunicola CBS 121167 TaxID=1176127 RepID=A0A6A6B0K7_9PEZI|nr:uncharacterized protein K452DRAFT_128481 [Aplosporella prunicola CBS 121167]KAF2136567.1 hypothetical protein K452DRAFT_128481 [Aplosporella prunicola CBS 121167]